MQANAELWAKGIAALVRDHVARAVAPLTAKIASLEADLATRPTAEAHAAIVARAAIDAAAAIPEPAAAAPGAPGERGDRGEPGPCGPAGAEGKAGPPGESPHVDSIRLMVLEEIGKAVGVLPRAQDGKSVSIEEVRPLLEQMVAAIPKPRDGTHGKDADPEITRALVVDEVARAVDAIPKPNDGDTGPQGEVGPRGEPGSQGPAGPQGEKGDAGSAGDRGETGAEGAAGLQGERGEIGATGGIGEKGADGVAGPIGPMGPAGEPGVAGVKGERGERGLDGARGDPGDPGSMGKDGAPGTNGEPGRDGRDGQVGVPGAAGEKGEAGSNGRDGIDGFSPDDLELAAKDDGRVLVVRLRAGERIVEREIQTGLMIYRGLYESGKPYLAGDSVSYGGSMFIAERATGEPPGTRGTGGGWRLAVKRGKDA